MSFLDRFRRKNKSASQNDGNTLSPDSSHYTQVPTMQQRLEKSIPQSSLGYHQTWVSQVRLLPDYVTRGRNLEIAEPIEKKWGRSKKHDHIKYWIQDHDDYWALRLTSKGHEWNLSRWVGSLMQSEPLTRYLSFYSEPKVFREFSGRSMTLGMILDWDEMNRQRVCLHQYCRKLVEDAALLEFKALTSDEQKQDSHAQAIKAWSNNWLDFPEVQRFEGRILYQKHNAREGWRLIYEVLFDKATLPADFTLEIILDKLLKHFIEIESLPEKSLKGSKKKALPDESVS